ncbi:hypothetical protein ABT373_31285 [Streptomyces sp. NPDC000070]|uniref:hypothetical protein n=1 Tax=Streptomyces sp. NPDC000070 TaxID=3154240 RepID=UPI0033237607
MTTVRVEPSWWQALRGTPGRGRDFIALIQDEPVLVVYLKHWRSPYARMALTVRDPGGSADLLRRHAGRARR